MRNTLVVLFLAWDAFAVEGQCKLQFYSMENYGDLPIMQEVHKDKIFLYSVEKDSSYPFFAHDIYQVQTGTENLPVHLVEKLNQFIAENCGEIYRNKVIINEYDFLRPDNPEQLSNNVNYKVYCQLEIQPAVYLLFSVVIDSKDNIISKPPFKENKHFNNIDICLSYSQIIKNLPEVRKIDIGGRIEMYYDQVLNQNIIIYLFTDYRNRKVTKNNNSIKTTYWEYKVSYNFQTKKTKIISKKESRSHSIHK